ncbi:sigma-70 family RNA polymerase sigma factor [uncultured Gimesia sp.]|uniref:sigma-70 family RNA polymerase sigma factor n=1 Tax=uncultured Gimesia sp. TaxID=1678688 RepID=UPI00260495D7|nr:sigma-70 family RNA polymerase sigma factor [uncultured Gimesia sp.]
MIASLETSTPEPKSTHRCCVVNRALELLETEIDFIPNATFNSADLEEEILAESLPDDLHVSGDMLSLNTSQNLPSYLSRLCEAEVLTAEAERNLFRRMNYFKFKANALRSQLDPAAPDEYKINKIDQYLSEALNSRAHLIRCNMRLVVSIVKKCVTPHVSFDELLSDGIWSLIKAADKFDYSRGFRFSTYAYHAISNFAYRTIADRRKANLRFMPATHTSALDDASEEVVPVMGEQIWGEMSHLLSKTMKNLDDREQLIIYGRFALGNQHKIRTFQSLADELGISKERVRQLEKRAVAKLRLEAEETDLEMMCDLGGY